MWRRVVVMLVVVCVMAQVESVGAAGRVTKGLDFDWRFHLGEVEGAQGEAFDDSAWRWVDVPHDFGVEGEYRRELPGQSGYLAGGVGWYRRVVEVGEVSAGRRYWVELDAVSMNSRVWVNGVEVGGRPYGYMSFACDVTKAVKKGRNVIAVRVDTSKLPNARWYAGSGIYGHVRWVEKGPVHVERWGVAVTTPRVTKEAASVRVATEVVGGEGTKVVAEVVDPAGKVVGKGEGSVCEVEVARPELWSPGSPKLYRAVVRVYRGEEMMDEVAESFGIRTVKWEAETGFWLNGENVKLRGVGMHWDAGGALGVAVPDSVVEWRVRQLKEMGCNAVRTGHTPFPPVFSEVCDRIGLMVIDEAFDGWRRKAAFDYGAVYYKEWWKRDLGDMIKRDRNHPSVIAWSLGNETGHRDVNGMSEFAHSIDPTRATTGGQLLEGVDVSGFTGRGESPGILEAFRKEHPGQSILLVEETHAYATRGHYRAVTKWRDEDKQGNDAKRQPLKGYAEEEIFTGGDEQWTSSYDNSLVRMACRQCTKRTNETPWIAGEFKWAGFDYLGEAQSGSRKWPLRYGTPGIMDSAGFRKDIFYFYQSQYTNRPMVHLLPDWSLDGRVKRGATVPVVAYSNCQEVELFKDGRSLGRKGPGELLEFVWEVAWEPGALRAVGYRGGKAAVEKVVATAGMPVKLALSADHAELGGRGDVVMVAVEARDEKGRLVPQANARVTFAVVGSGGRWIGAENGCPTDVASNKLPHRDLFAGLVRGYVAGTGESGDVEIVAGAVFREGKKVAVAVEALGLRGKAGGELKVNYTAGDQVEKEYVGPVETEGPVTVRVMRGGWELMRMGDKEGR